ncbi:MAG TPA: tetraacyldisaccharide 4'-kinase [Bryobacteraceae bacterium]|nr:tetraacyldisaccharide 4'-kinase [Bryobacteraceae bacterium]
MKTKGIYFLYRVLQAFGLPVLLLYFLIRGIRDRGYWRSLPQRFGFLPHSFRQTCPGAIWLHAVSVGEVIACVELVRRLRREFSHSGIFVSTSTLAGWATANQKLCGLADGIFYAPVDTVFAVRRVLRTLRPSVVVIAETEVWPNLFREVKRIGAGLTIVNGRISDRAFPRYRRFRWFFQAILPLADSVLAQTDAIRERFLVLGANPERVRTTGNFKFDFEPHPIPENSPVRAWIGNIRPEQVWIAASTMPPAEAGDVDEDDIVIAAYREIAASHPNLALILAPRKPERFDLAAEKLGAAAVSFVRRTSLPPTPNPQPPAPAVLPPTPAVLLLDTIGELSSLFAIADVVFMGGSLARRGGHNILEPALFAKPVIVGPHMENFRDIADHFRTAGASVEIAGGADLAATVIRLLENPDTAREIGRAALECAQSRRGATSRAVDEVRELHHRHVPRYRPATPSFELRWILARLWEWGSRHKRESDLRDQRKLDVPVISVGNLSMGGTGKTPCVLHLAAELIERGHKPGILTRGYGRGSHERHLLLEPGAAVKAEHSGDEPQIFVRSGLAPVGIGVDRVQTGRLLRNAFDLDVMVLDDGFQHLHLARDVDVVLIDALEPFGGGDVFPLGRLREPVTGLARADLILITRSDVSDLAPAVERAVRQWNRAAPVFRAWVEPRFWVEHRTRREYHIGERPFGRGLAFCGLGNPQSFRRTLEGLGLELADWVEFDDHHRYRPQEMQRLAQSALAQDATVLLTSEKDAVNLCDEADDLCEPLPIFWLKVRLKIDGEREFVDALERRIGERRRSLQSHRELRP